MDAAREVFNAALSEPEDDKKFWKLVELLPKDGPYVLVEGDLLLSTDELRRYLVARKDVLAATQSNGADPPAKPHDSASLLINFWSGKPFYLKDPRDRKLTYTINRRSFSSDDWYNTVVANFSKACSEWEQLCPRCQISFVHKAHLDASTVKPGQDVSFVVQQRSGNYVAAAFFPFSSSDTRYVSIDPSYFTTRFDRVGVLRHEIGHILGYRHELVREESGCFHHEYDGSWLPLNPYGARSVMQYYCRDDCPLQLQFSDSDRIAHSALYEKGQWRQFAAGSE